MKLKIYTFTTDNDAGLQTVLFLNKGKRDEAQWEHVAEYYEGELTLNELKEKYDNDVYAAFEPRQNQGGAIDSMNHDDQELEIPNETLQMMLDADYLTCIPLKAL